MIAPGFGPGPGRAPWGLGDIAKALGALIVIALILMVPAAAIASSLAGDKDVEKDPQALAVLITANIVLEALLLVVALRFSVFKYKLKLAALGFRKPERGGAWLPFAILVAAYVTLGVYYGILSAIGADKLQPSSTLPDDAFKTPVVTVLTAVLAIACAPLVEETFFRGFVFGSLRWRWSPPLAAFASGLLFAALHFDLGSIIPFTMIGMLLAFSYDYSGSLFSNIATHVMFNTIAVVGSIVQAHT